MRALWSSSISFGLINIPVKLYSASQNRGGIELNMLHKKDLSPIRFAKVCRKDGEEIPYDQIVRGYEYQDGDYVVLTDEDLEKAAPEKSKTIDIKQFAIESEIDLRYFEKPYYLEPSRGAEKPYALLREALKESSKVAVCTFALRTKQHVGAIKPVSDALVLMQMRFADEVLDPKELLLPPSEAADKSEIQIALKLIEQLTDPFNPHDFHDTYREELEELIEDKIEGKRPVQKGHRPTKTPNKDIMALLKASLEQGRKQKTGKRSA